MRRAVARGHPESRDPWMRVLRLRGVGHHLIGRRGGVGGERGGERGALHDPIVLTIFEMCKTEKVDFLEGQNSVFDCRFSNALRFCHLF